MAEREKLIELKDLQITFGTGRKKRSEEHTSELQSQR